jgi:hypothetical protein
MTATFRCADVDRARIEVVALRKLKGAYGVDSAAVIGADVAVVALVGVSAKEATRRVGKRLAARFDIAIVIGTGVVVVTVGETEDAVTYERIAANLHAVLFIGTGTYVSADPL